MECSSEVPEACDCVFVEPHQSGMVFEKIAGSGSVNSETANKFQHRGEKIRSKTALGPAHDLEQTEGDAVFTF